MIPSFPYGFKPESHEDEMFFSLEKLPNDYYIFYSFKLADLISENDRGLIRETWKEKEIDFVIYNRDKGLMVVEAKAGQVWCDHGIWRYGNGIEMKDPFKQADDGRWQLKSHLEDVQDRRNPITSRVKIQFAVWFPSISKASLNNIVLPQNADRNIILTLEDIDNPQESLDRIFSYDVINDSIQTNLSDADHKFMLDSFLCPSFNILPPKSYELDYTKKRFDAMIVDQYNILNYLEYQRNAVINGAAGTGKTLIAVEKARRHAAAGEKVLFLCFNNKLKEHLEVAYPYENVSYYTIDGFACKYCNVPIADYDFLQALLEECDEENREFPYQHVIIDEGQDFGQERMHADTIFELLEKIVLKSETGSFYIFYDKLQMIQSYEIPKYIEDADCRLTLYKNCRNTRQIADTSFRPLKLDKKPKLFDAALSRDNPALIFCNEENAKTVLDKVINKSYVDKIDDIQIISCTAEGNSIFKDWVSNEKYIMKNKSVGFTTARKFKGLEADHVILVDVDAKLLEDNGMLFYVGASRAKLQLSIITTIGDEECTTIIKQYGSNVKRNNPKDTLAKLLGCKNTYL